MNEHLSQRGLESYLWGAATLLRGLVDASDRAHGQAKQQHAEQYQSVGSQCRDIGRVGGAQPLDKYVAVRNRQGIVEFAGRRERM